MHACMLSYLSCVRLFATLWTVVHQAPLSMGFPRQEYWSELPCLYPGHLPDPGIEPTSPVAPALQMESLLLSHPGNPLSFISYSKLCNKEAGNVEIKMVCTYEQHLFCAARENKAEQSLQTLFKRESCFFFPSMLNTLLLVIRYGAVFFPIPSNSLIPSRHQLDGRESEWTPGVGDGQGGLACCNSWGRKELDTTEQLNWTETPTGCFKM